MEWDTGYPSAWSASAKPPVIPTPVLQGRTSRRIAWHYGIALDSQPGEPPGLAGEQGEMVMAGAYVRNTDMQTAASLVINFL
jgi:hypothetical protein